MFLSLLFMLRLLSRVAMMTPLLLSTVGKLTDWLSKPALLQPRYLANSTKAHVSDGFQIYGRKCSSTETYSTDGDDYNGHVSRTQYSEKAF